MPPTARLAAFCTAKGRMLASMLILRPADEVWLLCSADVLPATLKRLSMFVLRAKCKLSDAARQSILGYAGACAPVADAALAWDVREVADGRMLRLPDLPLDAAAPSVPRCLWVGSTEAATARLQAAPALPLSTWAMAGCDVWRCHHHATGG